MRNTSLQMMRPVFGRADLSGRRVLSHLFFQLLLILLLALLSVPVLVAAESGASSNITAAFSLYKEKAEQGDVEAQFNIGVMCETGWSVPVDNKKAVRWYREAAKQGHADAQVRLGMLYYLGVGARQSDIKGQKWIREAAKQNHPLASNLHKKLFSDNAPDALSLGLAIQRVRDAYLKNEKKASAVLNKLVADAKQQDAREKKQKEDSTIRERRVQRLTEGPIKPGFNESVEDERIKSVVPGFIGDASLEENRTLARGSVATIRLQAEKGLASAEYNLGRMYELGIKLPVDKQKALEWYTKSAKQGYASAEYRLGIALLYGAGVKQDDVQGKQWLTLAAKHEHAVAKKMVEGMRSALGTVNISMAANWYFERALGGDAESSFHLGKLYQYGWGVEADSREAIKWYRRASSLGFQEAGAPLRKLEMKMRNQKAAALPLNNASQKAPQDASKNTSDISTIMNKLEAMLEARALPVWLAHPGLIAGVVVVMLWAFFFRGRSRKRVTEKQEEVQEI